MKSVYRATIDRIVTDALDATRDMGEQAMLVRAAILKSGWVTSPELSHAVLQYADDPRALPVEDDGTVDGASFVEVLALLAYSAMLADVKQGLRIARAKRHIAETLAFRYA